jgi:two-component system, chemotaxis family, protein-glutamate methylesterase/glutaminase
MASRGRSVVVIGTSAGGLQALDELFGQIPSGLPASFLVVQHMAPEASAGALLRRLGRHRSFQCRLASDGEVFKAGRVYIAPPDYHLLVKGNRLLVTKGARENRYRPAVDPLFRSAAVSHGSRVIGVILTGLLDDGTAGLGTIKSCGGVTVVQDPRSAAYPDMPRSALANVRVDHCVPVAEMGALLERLIRARPARTPAIPASVRAEAEIAERVLSDVGQVNDLGHQVPYNCPNCGGVLWQIKQQRALRYRCHTGHSFTATALATSQAEKIEETLWVSLRMLEERKNLLNTMARAERRPQRRKEYVERAADTEVHVERVRAMLLAREPGVHERGADRERA